MLLVSLHPPREGLISNALLLYVLYFVCTQNHRKLPAVLALTDGMPTFTGPGFAAP